MNRINLSSRTLKEELLEALIQKFPQKVKECQCKENDWYITGIGILYGDKINKTPAIYGSIACRKCNMAKYLMMEREERIGEK